MQSAGVIPLVKDPESVEMQILLMLELQAISRGMSPDEAFEWRENMREVMKVMLE